MSFPHGWEARGDDKAPHTYVISRGPDVLSLRLWT
jgi:hypothetical protein